MLGGKHLYWVAIGVEPVLIQTDWGRAKMYKKPALYSHNDDQKLRNRQIMGCATSTGAPPALSVFQRQEDYC